MTVGRRWEVVPDFFYIILLRLFLCVVLIIAIFAASLI